MSTANAMKRAIRADPAYRWENVVIGAREQSGDYHVTETEMVDFARQYDPLPIHIDSGLARASSFGALTASGCHMLAIRQRLLYDFTYPGGVVASIGLDEVRYLAPLKADQICRVEIEFLKKAPSRSRMHLGTVSIGMALLADSRPILTLTDIVLMRRGEAC